MSYIADRFDDEVTRLLKAGAVGLLPADTVYGLSCRALDEAAVKRIYKLKKREGHKPFIILISNLKMLGLLSISPNHAKPARKYWPGPLSTILPSGAPGFLTCGADSLAVRMPDYPELLSLIDKTGPLISTSANLTGRKPAENVAEAKRLFGSQLDFYVDTGRRRGQASTIVKPAFGKLEVIREGAAKIKREDLL